jgi:hypothetical protein
MNPGEFRNRFRWPESHLGTNFIDVTGLVKHWLAWQRVRPENSMAYAEEPESAAGWPGKGSAFDPGTAGLQSVGDSFSQMQRSLAQTQYSLARLNEISAGPTSLLHRASPAMARAVLTDEHLLRRVLELEQDVQFTVEPRTRSGARLKTISQAITEELLDELRPEAGALDRTLAALEREGFTILHVGSFGVSASGPVRLIADVLKTPLAVAAIPRSYCSAAPPGFPALCPPPMPGDLFAMPPHSLCVEGTRLDPAINDFMFIPPPVMLSVSNAPPAVTYPFLDESTVRNLLKIPTSGEHAGLTGKGVNLAMIDSGFRADHPYYLAKGADFAAVNRPGGQADVDDEGHGTAMAWNTLACAPGCQLRGYTSNQAEVAFELAAADGARIISCSWGYPNELVLKLMALTIAATILRYRCVVLFAAGNGRTKWWPACMPWVISVGGVYADPATGVLEASDYASGFHSKVYPRRDVPDISGLCGKAPESIYLPMPVPQHSVLDRKLAARRFPYGDNTRVDDGWVYSGGTSAATAQVAGVVALMLEHASALGKTLTRQQLHKILTESSQSVLAGRNSFGTSCAGLRPNTAVGWGLVDAGAALERIDRL